MRRSNLAGVVLFVAGLAVIGLAGLWLISQTGRVAQPGGGIASTPSSSIGGPFKLVGHDGGIISDETLKGRPFLVFFGFTHCPDICPTKLFELSEVLNAMGEDGNKFPVLFVTVDPERDTVETMARYLSSFHDSIRGATGDQAAVDAMVKTYRAYARKVPLEEGYTMDHTAVVYLMDREGRFVDPVNLDRPPADVARDLRRYL